MEKRWEWIKRNVEPTVQKWLKTPGAVVLIRGRRRVGKSSTIKKVAKDNKLEFIDIYIKTIDDEVCLEIKEKLQISSEVKIWNVGIEIIKAIQTGKIIILEEIQNASSSLQVSLQQGIDKMAQDFMFDPDSWNKAGGLFLMGSLPGIVDSMIESRRNALYQRIVAKITVLPFDTKEICELFKRFGLDKTPELMLCFHTLFGSLPFLYESAHRAGLLHPNITPESLLKEFFASELQHGASDAEAYYKLQFGKDMAHVIKAVANNKTKSTQISYIAKKLDTDDDNAWSMLQDMDARYGIIKPYFCTQKGDKVLRYEIVDPTFLISHTMESLYKRDDVNRDITLIDLDSLKKLEGQHLELWVKEIIEDRYLLTTEPIFPHEHFSNDTPYIEHSKWNDSNVEIDLVISIPKTKKLIFCSCKRSLKSDAQKQLVNHVKPILRDFPAGLVERLRVPRSELSTWEINYVHIYCIQDENEGPISKKRPHVYYFSLQNLLSCFLK